MATKKRSDGMTIGRKAQRFIVKIVGVRPLLLHSDRSIDRKEPAQQEVEKIHSKSKKQRTSSDDDASLCLKFQLCCYGDWTERLWIPCDNVMKAITEAAPKVERGIVKLAESGLRVDGVDGDEDQIGIEFPPSYKGPKTGKDMWLLAHREKNPDPAYVFSKSVRIPPRTGARVPFSRPRLPVWGATFSLTKYPFSPFSEETLQKLVVTAGEQVGLCDWRPRYGLFQVESFEEVDL